VNVDSWDASRRAYLEALAPPDIRKAVRLVGDLIADGATIGEVVEEVLRPAQIEVGRRWQDREWGVADEHAASAVTEAALMAAAASVAKPRSAGRVVLACATDEWHTLPLRMVSEVLAEAGFDSVFLGPSVPADHLRAFLSDTRPLALALNCSYALTLEGTRECVAAAHALGVPVVVGGRGLGPDAHRASIVGADAWSEDAASAVGILSSWVVQPPGVLATANVRNDEAMPTAVELERHVQHVMASLRQAFPAMRSYTDAQLSRTSEDIEYVIRFGVAAIRYRDERIFTEFAGWLLKLLDARSVPPAVVSASFDAIADALMDDRPAVAALLRTASTTNLAPAQPVGTARGR
jgi:methanogenic corrinoid protein MtbC1